MVRRSSRDLVLVEREREELETQRLRTVTKYRGVLKSGLDAANVEKRKVVKERKELEKRAVFIRKLRLGKNLKHNPFSTFDRTFALKVCNCGNIPDSRYQAVVEVVSLHPLVSHVVCSPLLLATTGNK